MNKIGDDGLSALTGALSSGALPALKNLDLYRNNIGDVGLSAFADALSSGALDRIHCTISLFGNLGDSAPAYNAMNERWSV